MASCLCLFGLLFKTTNAFSSPYSLSSLNGVNGFAINGVAGGDNSGYAVSGAGDVNGDGVDDIIVAAYQAHSAAGSSYIIFGKKKTNWTSPISLASLNGSNGFRLDGGVGGEQSGYSVSAAGDINGDNVDDLLVGAPKKNNGAGSTYVVYGKTTPWSATLTLSSLNGVNGFRIDGVGANNQSGTSVSAADINGDGVNDVIIGVPKTRSNAGSTYIVFGKKFPLSFPANFSLSSLNGTNGFELQGVTAGDSSGSSVSGAGDVNGDGVDDLIIGAPNAQSNAGVSYVVFGAKNNQWSSSLSLSMLNGVNGFRMYGGIDNQGQTGTSVSKAGDVNGDGVDDIIVGSPYSSPGISAEGSTYLVFGKKTAWDSTLNLYNLNGTNGVRLDGDLNNELSGYSVSGAGDVNGDGYDDLIIGAYAASRSSVVFGQPPSAWRSSFLLYFTGVNGFRLDGTAGDYSGFSVCGAGDINGDGGGDIIIGAYQASPNSSMTHAGSSYVIFGIPPPTLSPTTFSPTHSPTLSPTRSPTLSPTRSPTLSPTLSPTRSPTFSPTLTPTFSPTALPTPSPTLAPASSSTPTPAPSSTPTPAPSSTPSPTASTLNPTTSTLSPILSPTLRPTPSTLSPTRSPTLLSPTRSPSTHSPTIKLSPATSPTISSFFFFFSFIVYFFFLLR